MLREVAAAGDRVNNAAGKQVKGSGFSTNRYDHVLEHRAIGMNLSAQISKRGVPGTASTAIVYAPAPIEKIGKDPNTGRTTITPRAPGASALPGIRRLHTEPDLWFSGDKTAEEITDSSIANARRLEALGRQLAIRTGMSS